MPGPSSSTSSRAPRASAAGSRRAPCPALARRERQRRLGRVDEQVPEHLPHLVGVARRPRRRELLLEPHARRGRIVARRRRAPRRAPRRGRCGAPAERRRARVLEESVTSSFEPRRLAEHDVHEPARRPAGSEPSRRSSIEPDIAASGLRSSWARPAATRPRSASRALRWTALLHGPQRGEVLEDDGAADRRAVRAAQREARSTRAGAARPPGAVARRSRRAAVASRNAAEPARRAGRPRTSSRARPVICSPARFRKVTRPPSVER